MSNEETTVPEAEIEITEDDYSPFLYIYSQGCGWCKKSEPIVDELNKDEELITKLDLADGENQKIANEIKQEFGIQCGTPLFVNEETGKFICGFREKDILEKWLAGEDIPAPPRPKSMPPKPPFHGASKKEEKAWKKEYAKWLKDNDHLPDNHPQKRTADQILSQPRPKSDPPPPPPMGADDSQYDSWGEKYGKWVEENSHLPNLQPVDVIMSRLKSRGNPQAMQNAADNTEVRKVNDAKLNTLEAKVNALEVKIDKIMNHFGVK